MEKPLLHKVLHKAGFKARGASPRAKTMRVVPDKENDIVGNTNTAIHVEKSPSCQLFSTPPPPS